MLQYQELHQGIVWKFC